MSNDSHSEPPAVFVCTLTRTVVLHGSHCRGEIWPAERAHTNMQNVIRLPAQATSHTLTSTQRITKSHQLFLLTVSDSCTDQSQFEKITWAGLLPGSEASRCCWSNPDAERLCPYLHSSPLPDSNLCSPAQQQQQQQLLLQQRSTPICRTQTNTSWASIKHRLSSPAVLGCQRETERVSPEQPPSPSQHFHYVSLDKLLPPSPPPSTSSPLLWAAHNLVSSLSDTIRTHSLWEIHLSFTAFHMNHSRQKNQLWLCVCCSALRYVTRSHKNKHSHCKILRLCQWCEAASVHRRSNCGCN